MPIIRAFFLTAVLISAVAFSPLAGAQVDEDAAVSLAKKGNCFKCHAIDKRKKAPSYKEIAKKYASKANAEQDLYLHITGTPIVNIEEGDEPHTGPPSKDRQELDNLIRWVLSRDKAQ